MNSLATTQKSKTNSETQPWLPTLDAYHPDLAQARDSAARYVADMAQGVEPYWLTFCGLPGTGKTMLARQIYEQAKIINPGSHAKAPVWYAGQDIFRDENRRPLCVWLDAAKFADRMKRGEFDLPESFGPDFLVVFDDLGASRDKTDFIPEAVYRLSNLRARRWMVWTTNLRPNEIAERMDPRIASRLIRGENKLITLRCGDYALKA